MTDKTKVPHTLLLADDSVTIQRVIELTFADEAIKVVAVSDGDQAIARIESDPPDIVLVDIGMPGRSGYEVAQHIKQSPRLKHIPVLLLTGAFEPVDQAKAVAVGCDGVLAKPFEPQLVIARVKELLERGGQAPAASPAQSPEPAAPPAKQPVTSKSDVAQLDSYFDQLDAAFQTLDTSAPANQLKGSASASPVTDSIDWFGGAPTPSTPSPDLPLSSVKPAQRVEPKPFRVTPERAEAVVARPVRDAATSEPPSPPAPLPSAALPPPSPAALPPLADAFAAILAAEQHVARPAGAPARPPPSTSSNGGGSLSEEVVEDITRRVLDRLSDRIVHDTVAEVISGIAERLVKEEIERIKATIK
jgi:CheY-like chemotaxis protein